MSKPYGDPQSRNEAILQNMLGESNVLEAPRSRIEVLLQLLLGKLQEIEQGSEETVTDTGAVTKALEAGTFYDFTGNVTSLTLTFAQTEGVAHYHFAFISGDPAVTLNLPASVKMTDGFEVEANKRYEIDIVDNYGVSQEWSVT